MGGGIDPLRVRLVRPVDHSGLFRVVGVEDIIADRMGQFASGSAPETREQARALLKLYPDIDRDYLEKRVRKETLDEYGFEDI